VPVTVTRVAAAPGEPPTGGAPLVVLRVTAARTVKDQVDNPMSPVVPVTLTVYDCPAAVFETMKNVPKSVPVESIAQVDEVNNPVGADMNEVHAPASRVENGFAVVSVTRFPAIPVAGPRTNVGAGNGVKVVSA
jgi:hypothetical protein